MIPECVSARGGRLVVGTFCFHTQQLYALPEPVKEFE